MESRQELLDKAKELELEFSKNISNDKLKKLIEKSITGPEPEMQPDHITEAALREQIEKDIRVKLEEEYQRKLDDLAEAQKENSTHQSPYRPAGRQKVLRKREAEKLVRVIVTNRNPMKQSWDGEIISVSNDIGVNVRKYVPFGLTSGYHLPQIMVNVLRDKQCTVFVNRKGRDGKMISEAKLIKEYGIEILPDLTKEELEELADDQRARGALDE
jgi:hypothetical protein